MVPPTSKVINSKGEAALKQEKLDRETELYVYHACQCVCVWGCVCMGESIQLCINMNIQCLCKVRLLQAK